MTRSTLLGTLAGLLLALDGVSVAVSRTALLDGPLTFFVVAAFAALVLDRDHARARLATWVRQRPPGVPAPAGPGPGLGLRPLRVLAGVLLGLACATKWSGLWFLVSFGLMTVLWDRGARRLAGVRTPTWATVRSDVMPAFLSLVPVAVAVYLVSWTGWFRSEGGYDRLWYQSNPATSGWTWVPGPLRSLWHYHAEMLQFHRTLETPHSYQAHPAGWTVLVRPTAFWSQTFQPGQDGCVVRQGSTCIREVTALGPPVLWWAATLALAWLVYQWAVQRDWRAGAALNGVAAGWLPWLLLFSERTIFAFYAVVFSPFLVMGLTLALGAVLGPADAPGSRRTWGAAAVGAFVLLLVANAAWLFPLWSGVLLPYDDWYARLWFRGWI